MTARRGELVRERRRQRGLPLPVADKVLPFRPSPTPNATSDDLPTTGDDDLSAASDPLQLRAALADGRVAEAFAAFQDVELRGAPRRVLAHLPAAALSTDA